MCWYVRLHDSRWWLTIQCAASSFSCGTSNRAWLNSSSRAVGLVLGSTSRHFWINSCKNKHTSGQTSCLRMKNLQRWIHQVRFVQDMHADSPSAVDPPITGWHCWWPPEKHKRTFHSPGFPREPSRRNERHFNMLHGEITSNRVLWVSPLRHTCQMSRCLRLWWHHQQLKWKTEKLSNFRRYQSWWVTKISN